MKRTTPSKPDQAAILSASESGLGSTPCQKVSTEAWAKLEQDVTDYKARLAQAMAEVGVSVGDTVSYDVVSPFGYAETFTGRLTITNRGEARVTGINGTRQSRRWHKGWRKAAMGKRCSICGKTILNTFRVLTCQDCRLKQHKRIRV